MSYSICSIHKASVEITASTTTANAALPVGDASKYIRVVNSTNGIAYVNAGLDNTVAATAANVAVRPGGEAIFERSSSGDNYVAVMLSNGATTGRVSFTLVGV